MGERKSKPLSLRLHPHVMAACQSAALIRGQSITAFVERAIMAVATVTEAERAEYDRLYPCAQQGGAE